MIQIKNVYQWILPVYQPYLLNYDYRTNVFYGGAGSGKSYFVVQNIIIKGLMMKRKVLVVRKVGTTIKDSIWALFLELLYQMPQVIQNINKSDYTITLINGTQFVFKGMDDPEKVKSIQGVTDEVIEEASELNKDDFDQLKLRLRSNEPNNQIFLMFNPVSKANWTYKEFFENGTPDNCRVVHTTYKDNPHLPEDYVQELLNLEKTSPTYYKIYVLGTFATLDKLVFPKHEVRLISDEECQNSLFWCGMDFGYVNDPTAITWGYYKPELRRLLITGEYNKKGMTNDVIANTLVNLGLSKEIITADSAEPKSIAEIKRAGIIRIKGAVKGPDSVRNGIDKLLRCEIVIDERCTYTIEEFDNYTWKKDRKTGEYINEPVDSFNHHIDSIRYGTQNIFKKKIRTKADYEAHYLA